MKREKVPKDAEAERLALCLLSNRDHSEGELIQKLKARGFSEKEIEPTIQRLKALGFLSDSRYALELAARWAKKNLLSNAHIGQRLAQRGIDQDLIRKAMLEAERALPTAERIQRLIERQRARYLRPKNAKFPMNQFLLRRGFLPEEIGPVIDPEGGFQEE